MPHKFSNSELGRLLFSKFTVLLLIAGLVMPLFLVSGIVSVKAERPRKVQQTSAIKSAPPEPFVIGGSTNGSSFQTSISISLAAAAVSMLSVFGIPAQTGKSQSDLTQPEEREAASRPANNNTATEENRIVDEEEPEAEEQEPESNVEPAPVVQPAGVTDFDFDGDGKADIGRWHKAGAEFKVRNSNGGSFTTVTIGDAASVPVPGDFFEAGDFDIAVFKNGTWTISGHSPISLSSPYSYVSGDIPAAGDFDGDGKSDAAVFRPSNGTWYVRESDTGSTVTQAWGLSGDIPAAADFDGDGHTDFAVFRPSNGNWWILGSTAGMINREWGLSGDVPVPADYDGDGEADIAVYRPSNGTWYVRTAVSGFYSGWTQTWGNYGDQPVPADYDGDGQTDFAIWRPKTGVWHILKSSNAGIDTHALGVPGDFAIPSAYLKQTGYDVPADELGMARLLPKNATGGTNLYSQNFSWGTALVGLPGRSGLDAGFGIGYNSLVWTKVDNTMVFDADAGSLTPGFRFGFPVIEPVLMNGAASKYAYLMVTPSGSRVEFRQTSVAGFYETVDANYAQLQTLSSTDPNDPVEDLTIEVTTTDGTKMRYEWSAGAFRCTQIKDRNGNFITIGHSDYGDLLSVTDTLGRVVNINYSNGLPSTITQTWKDTNGSGSNTTHTYAAFTYATKTIATDFDEGLGVAGPLNGWDVTVLERITYADTSSTKFHYNGYAQVWKIENFADNNDLLNYVRTDLETPDEDQPDCPRFANVWNQAANFNGGTPIKTGITYEANESFDLPDSLANEGTLIEVTMEGHPYEAVSKMIVGDSGWREGLTLATEDWAKPLESGSFARQRWTWTSWTQDDEEEAPEEEDFEPYKRNPRVIETRVGDSANIKKTTVGYGLAAETNISIFGLPEEVITYKSDLSTAMKRVEYDYIDSSTYVNRRMIGLPLEVRTYGWSDGTSSEQYTSRTTYEFDTDGYAGGGQSLSSATQHDTANYGTSFSYRGNLTKVTRLDPTSTLDEIESSTIYNIAGSPISQTTPWDGSSTRTVSIGYADAWNDSVSRTTYAYPTTITDPASNSSTVLYRYDIGANVSATSPTPAGQSYGKTTKRVYDEFGRLERNSVYVNTTETAYTRYEYPSNGIQSKVYSTVVDIDSDGADADDEVLSETFTDGAGRIRLSRVPHTFSGGSTATWAGTITEYDILGRVKRQSVPTEVNSSWEPTGDDSAFLWNSQEYDWMGRTTRTIPTDSNGSDGKDTLISYAGCGCAGGLVTTVEGPLVPRDDAPETNARRKQKSYADILGRTFKTETFEWNGTDVYLKTETEFNGRDQAIEVTQTDLSGENPVAQVSTMSFDGHGRLYQSHRPEQRVGETLKYTTYSYNPDGSILNVTDGRGAVTNYTYNSRGLPTAITWDVPYGSGIADPANVSFGYDDAGNRTSMTDGLGSVSYAYDSLSQMTNETRIFSDTLTDKPGGDYDLDYTYHIGGQLKSITDPWEKQINYAYDIAGRLNTVAGSASYGGITTYASNPEYRAWGGLKHLEYGNAVEADLTYDNSLRPATYNLQKTGSNPVMQKSYEYNPDASLKFVDDALNGVFDRAQAYDHQGRVTAGKSSTEASGTTVTTDLDTQLPYRQSYGYNAFGNMTTRENLHWGTEQNLSYGYINNRITGWTYDADGRATTAREGLFYNYQEFDARGSLIRTYGDESTNSTDIEPEYSGDGREGKRNKKLCNGTPLCYWQQLDPTYYIRSTVLGGEVISEVDHTGKKKQTFVYATGAKIATQSISIVESVPVEGVTFEHSDAGGVTLRTTFSNGSASGLPVEFDPSGANAGAVTPYPEPDPEPEELEPIYQMLTDAPLMVNGFIPPCTIDGILLRGVEFCSGIADRLNNGSAIPASIAWAQQNPGFSFTNHGFGIFSGHLGVDLWTNNTGKRWLQLTGTRGDGWMIGSGAFSFSLNWATQQQTRLTLEGTNAVAQSDDLTKNPNVLKVMYCLLSASGWGLLKDDKTERASWITQNAGTYEGIRWPWSAESGRETWRGEIPTGALAIMHTHPANMPAKPSTSGGITGRGDQGTAEVTKLPVYVITRNAVWKAVPGMSDPVQVLSGEWWKSLYKQKVKCDDKEK